MGFGKACICICICIYICGRFIWHRWVEIRIDQRPPSGNELRTVTSVSERSDGSTHRSTSTLGKPSSCPKSLRTAQSRCNPASDCGRALSSHTMIAPWGIERLYGDRMLCCDATDGVSRASAWQFRSSSRGPARPNQSRSHCLARTHTHICIPIVMLFRFLRLSFVFR